MSYAADSARALTRESVVLPLLFGFCFWSAFVGSLTVEVGGERGIAGSKVESVFGLATAVAVGFGLAYLTWAATGAGLVGVVFNTTAAAFAGGVWVLGVALIVSAYFWATGFVVSAGFYIGAALTCWDT